MVDSPSFWPTAFDGLLCLMILLLGWRVVFTTDLFRAALTFFVFGLLVSLAWVRLQAVDLALAEAAIGAGLTGDAVALTIENGRLEALKPAFGGFDPRAMRLALRPIPVFESSLTLHTKEQVHAMMAVMGDNDICIMRGHGVVVCGKSVEEATIKAIKLDALAEINLALARLGKSATISEADIAAFQARAGKGDGSLQPVWRYYVEWLKNS